jgi:dihydrofolate synthase / folylpolyglutamate synthase
MPDMLERYQSFLVRLKAYERVEPLPQSRRPDKLAGVHWLLDGLGHPETALQVVHVAGTNGKGMTSAMTARLLQKAGHSTGLYTSPHVVDLRERIVLNGQLIPEAAFADAGHRVLDVADAGKDRVYFSYFDVLTAIGVFAFREAGCAWAVLETGMGGLSDATNAIPKRMAILTRIGFDHMYVLGNTLREIAEQKLGIVQQGAPTVLGEQAPELEPWMADQIQAKNSPLLSARDFRIDVPTGSEDRVRAVWPDRSGVEARVSGASLTAIKAICAANALCAAEGLLGPAQGDARRDRLVTAMDTELPGRLERRSDQRIVGTQQILHNLVLDGGHNAGALDALADQLGRWGMRGYNLIIGLQADKLVPEVRGAVGRVLAEAKHVVILAPQTARAPAAETLAAFLQSALPAGHSPVIETVPDAAAALQAVARTPQTPMIATGSFWMLGDLMRLLEPTA